MDALAEDHRAVTLAVEGLEQVRVLIAAGTLVPRVALYVTVADDGAVEIIHLQIDTDPG